MSNLRFFGRILSLFIVTILIYLIIFTTSLLQPSRSIRTLTPYPTQSDSILLYRAYYDNRTGPGRLRILAISPCLPTSAQLSIRVGSSDVSLIHVPLETSCPWTWAPACKWNAYHLESPPLPFQESVVLVNQAGQSVVLPVSGVRVLSSSLEVCVPPLYWYDDWPRLLLFVEYLRMEGAFITIYVNSVTYQVKQILDYYESQGVIRMVNWPMLPLLKEEDPNKSVYRLSHSLAHNDCVLRSSSKFTTLLDIDEFIYVRNLSLLDFVKSKFSSDSSIGSLQFEHLGLISETPMVQSFDALESLKVKEVEGPSKVVFNPSSILFLSTHKVNTHVEGFHRIAISKDEAFLLHMRVSFGDKKIGERIAIDDRFSRLKDRVIETSDVVFGSTIRSFTLNVTNEVIRCTSKWRNDGCKTPIHSCYSQLISMEDWFFAPPSINSHFIVL